MTIHRLIRSSIAVALLTVPAFGQTTINSLDRGWYDDTGAHAPTNDNYAVGDGRDCCGVIIRNWFTFDLSAVSGLIGNATLVLENPSSGYDSGDANETYDLFDVVTDIDALMNGSGGLAAYDDLANGQMFGSRQVSAADNATDVRIPLNGAAIAALNAAIGDRIAIGGALTTLDGGTSTELFFSFTPGGGNGTRLEINTVAETTLDAVDRGWYDSSGSHNPNEMNYVCGDARGCCEFIFRDFFVFDLDSLAGNISDATLVIEMPGNGYQSSDGAESYSVVDVTTDVTTLTNGSGGLAAYDDLGSGTVYAGRDFSASDNGSLVRIPLNKAAIDAMNGSGGGEFAFGGHIVSLDDIPNEEAIFAFSSGETVIQLELSFSAWTDLGCALPGTRGDPELGGNGPLTDSSANQIELTNALPGAPALIFASFASIPFDFKGGTLKANPADFLIPLSTGSGNLTLPFTLPPVGPGLEFFVQAVIIDPAAVEGVAITNTIKGTSQN